MIYMDYSATTPVDPRVVEAMIPYFSASFGNPSSVHRYGQKYGAVAGDWESGAIAFVAARNNTRCLILRSVSDLVDKGGSNFYSETDLFSREASQIMERLFDSLPGWLRCAGLTTSPKRESGSVSPQLPDKK